MAKGLRRQALLHLLVVFLYTTLALVLTWPLIRHLGTHVPGSYTWAFDEYTFLWNTWWFRYSLFDLAQNPLFSTHTFYPLGVSLVLYTYNLTNAVLSLPLQAFLSLPAISNLTFLFATIMSGYGTFLLVRFLLDKLTSMEGDGTPASLLHSMAAFLAGILYAYGSYRLVYAAIGHYDMWSTAWIPLFVLYLVRTIREPGYRNSVLAAVFVVLAMLSEMIFGVFLGMLAFLIVGFALTKNAGPSVAGGEVSLVRRLLVMGLIATILYAPILAPILSEMLGGYELSGWGDAERLSVDLLGLITPTALHPLGGDWTETLRQTREGTARFRDVNTVFLGWMGLALAIVGAVRYRRKLGAWITGAILFAVLSLGPLLQINGRSTFDFDGLLANVPLPFILLHYIPVVKANRVPNRFGVVLMLSLAVLASFGIYWLLGKLRRSPSLVRIGALLLAAILVFEHWSVPLPLTDARVPSALARVAGEPGDFAILQLPMGWRNSFGVQGAESTQTQYYQSYHHKRLLSGNISRNPPFKFDYFQRQPIVQSLINLQTYGEADEERRAEDRLVADDFVGFYDIRYVAVAPGVPGRPPFVDTRADAVEYIEDVLPVVEVHDEAGWLLYRVDQPPLPTALRVDLGSSDLLESMALGEGWAEAEEIQGTSARWATEQRARFFLPSSAEKAYRLTLTALPFTYPGAETQAMQVVVNGRHLPERLELAPGWGTYNWNVPADVLRQGLNDLRLEFDQLSSPAEVLPGDGTVGSTGVRTPTAIEVNSGGLDGYAYITLGDSEDGSLHQSGYNLAVVHPETGELLDRRGFDTSSSGSALESDSLSAFIAAVPDGQIIVVALQGEGNAHLSEDAVSAFRSIGGQADPRELGGSHAIIGVKGATPGSALEAIGAGGGWLRVAPDERTLSVAVDRIQWEQFPD
jgi:hypothetical protein